MTELANTVRNRLDRVLIALCITEVVSWGVLYYSLPAAAAFISRDTGWSSFTVTGSFSGGLVLSALIGIFVGRALDRFGPRTVMTLGSVVGTLGIVAVSLSTNLLTFALAWLVVGIAQSAVLYQPAFTVIGRRYGEARNRPLLVVTLVAGLASTIFVPLTTLLIHVCGWRLAFALLAVILAAATIPLHATCLPATAPSSATEPRKEEGDRVVRTRRFVLLQSGITICAFGLYAVTINLIPLFAEKGASPPVAAAGLALVGVGQVAGRLLLTLFISRVSVRFRPLVVGLSGGAVLAALGLVAGPIGVALALGILAGAVRGALTLVQATAVVDRWGTDRLGVLNGAFAAPVTIATAIAPVAGVLLASAAGSFAAAAIALGVAVALGGVLAARH